MRPAAVAYGDLNSPLRLPPPVGTVAAARRLVAAPALPPSLGGIPDIVPTGGHGWAAPDCLDEAPQSMPLLAVAPGTAPVSSAAYSHTAPTRVPYARPVRARGHSSAAETPAPSASTPRDTVCPVRRGSGDCHTET